MSDEKDDGVNREGLDYRAGFVEAMTSFAQRMQIASLRAKKSQLSGMEAAILISAEMRREMIAKMKGE